MKMSEFPSADNYDPNCLFNTLLRILHLDSDEALCKALHIPPYIVPSIRRGEASMAPSLLIRMHELSGIPIRELRCWMGDRRSEVRFDETRSARTTKTPSVLSPGSKPFLDTDSDDTGLSNAVQWC